MANMICISNMSTTGKKFRLQNINLSLEEGFILGVYGENGAGKTTLMRTLMHDKEYEGSIQIFGLELRDNREEILKKTAFISDDKDLFMQQSVRNNAKLYSAFYPEYQEEVFLEYLDKFEVPKSTVVGKLSRGEKIRFQMAFAIACGCKLFLLDEATAGMDIVFRRDFFKELRKVLDETGASVVLTTHISEEIHQIVDYSMEMKNGMCMEVKEVLL